MRIIIITIALILYLSVPTMAEDTGIHGEITFRNELMQESPGQYWAIDLHYNFTDWLSIGVTETTFTNGYKTYFEMIPVYSPLAQIYEFYFNFDISRHVSVKLSQWCNHPIVTNEAYNDYALGGLYVEGKYKF